MYSLEWGHTPCLETMCNFAALERFSIKKVNPIQRFTTLFLLIFFGSYIEGREIRCAVVESAATGELKALSCIEYKVRENDIRRTEDKLDCNEKGLPVGKYCRYMSLILSTTPVLTYVLRSHIFRAHFQVNWVPSSEIF